MTWYTLLSCHPCSVWSTLLAWLAQIWICIGFVETNPKETACMGYDIDLCPLLESSWSHWGSYNSWLILYMLLIEDHWTCSEPCNNCTVVLCKFSPDCVCLREVHRLISVNVVELWKVPPDAVESMIRQLVNQFVHDRARPEVQWSNSPFIQLVFLFLLQ